MKQRFTLKKYQILRKDKEISFLFENGKSVLEYPLKAIYLLAPVSEIISSDEKADRFKVMFIVPKKNIRKSAYRNRIKRKIKESFRLLQHDLNVQKDHLCLIAFIYIAKTNDENILATLSESISKVINNINTR